LIPEASAAIVRPQFATSRAAFATSPVFDGMVLAPLSPLSISLKKKKKESQENRKLARVQRHESAAFCHQSRALPIF
jgi:hypothetical protein